VKYADDKAILAWETGNELESPPAWTREIAAYIKSLDKNHPVIDGFHSPTIRDESLAIPEVDIVTTHHYPAFGKSFAQQVRDNWAKAKGKKPYFLGEFGFVDLETMKSTLDAVSETGACGALTWSLRPRNRDGGFYWHSEPLGGDKFKAYHWPGFESGRLYDEIGFMKLMQERAYAIRGLTVPQPEKPEPPKLLPIQDAAAISWQGSAGAIRYQVQRAAAETGPWEVAGENIDETVYQYRPLFADKDVKKGKWHYRVFAFNAEDDSSKPSNVVGPVAVDRATLVDEMADASNWFAQSGKLEFKTRDSRKTKEDATRLAGEKGSSIIYELPADIQACRLYAFFPGEVADYRFFVSADRKNFTETPCMKKLYFSGAGDYGYWKPVLFTCKPESKAARYLKIEFPAESQISRIEIDHDFAE
jgi:hypothetical protein